MISQFAGKTIACFKLNGTGNNRIDTPKHLFLKIRILFLIVISAFSSNASDLTALIGKIKEEYARNSSPFPVIKNVEYREKSVGAYKKFEISFDLDATYANPFDPDDIDVEGHFIYPDGREVTVPGFFYDRYEPVNNKTTNTYLSTYYDKKNESGWKIRFSSGMTGDYFFYITAKDAKGQTGTTERYPFSIVPSGSKGFVRVSEVNPRYFENSADGSLFYGSGSNIHAVIGSEKDTAKQNFEYYFNKGKGNFSSTRIWICHYRWLEWTPNPDEPKTHTYGGLNFYNQAIAANLDRIYEMAEEIDLRIQLTLEDNQEHEKGEKYHCWKYNPYNAKNDGPVATPEEYWASKEVRRFYKKKLRYIAARWGYSTSMWSLNQWNDMSNPTPEQVDYSRELHNYVHSVFDGWRPVVFGSNFGHETDRYMDYAMFGKSRVTSKPGVTQECYYSSNIEWFKSELQDELWEGLFQGNATRMIWPHWMVDRSNAWPVFKSILNFVSDVPLNKKNWEPLKVKTSSVNMKNEEVFHRVIEVKGYGDIPSSGVKTPQNLFYIDNNESGQFLEGYAAGAGWQGHVLYGEKNEALRNPPSFVIDVPESGSMLIKIKIVGPGKHRLTTTVNGKQGPSGDWSYNQWTEVKGRSKEEEYLSIPLEKGKNEIRLDCEGPEFIRIGWVYFILDTTGPNGSLAASAMVGGEKNEAIVYLKNQTYTELYHTVIAGESRVLKGIQIEVPGLQNGEYEVAFFDPSAGKFTGKSKARSENGRLVCPVSQVEKDLALNIKKISRKDEMSYPLPSGWYKAQQHSHSTWSDGKQPVTENVRFARRKDFKILVTTDHSTMLDSGEIKPMKEEINQNNKPDFLSVYGIEVSYNSKTSPPDRGHLLVYDVDGFITHKQKQPQDVFNECNEQGGLAFIAHPYNYPYNFTDWNATGYSGIEVWNGADYNVFLNENGAWTPTGEAFKKWDELNRQGRRLVGIANADAHCAEQIGDLWTVVYIPRFTKADYLNSLARGNAYGTNGPAIRFTVDDRMMGSDVVVPAAGKDVYINISGNSNTEHPITKVRLIKNGKLEQEWLNPGGTGFSVSVKKFAKPGDFFRATVECLVKVQTDGKTKNGSEYAAFSNPVWITSGK